MNAPLGHRETADGYHSEIARQGCHRVILCRDGIQWIVQRHRKGAGARWQSVGYCTTRAALIRLWPGSHTGVPHEIIALPETTRGQAHG